MFSWCTDECHCSDYSFKLLFKVNCLIVFFFFFFYPAIWWTVAIELSRKCKIKQHAPLWQKTISAFPCLYKHTPSFSQTTQSSRPNTDRSEKVTNWVCTVSTTIMCLMGAENVPGHFRGINLSSDLRFSSCPSWSVTSEAAVIKRQISFPQAGTIVCVKYRWIQQNLVSFPLCVNSSDLHNMTS